MSYLYCTEILNRKVPKATLGMNKLGGTNWRKGHAFRYTHKTHSTIRRCLSFKL